MADSHNNYDASHPCEGSPELNGKDASYRNAALISPPRTIRKMRVKGALVPMRREDEAPGS